MSEKDVFNPLLAVGLQYVHHISPKLSSENTETIAKVLKNFIENKISFEESSKTFRDILGSLNPLERIDAVLKVNDTPIPKPSKKSKSGSKQAINDDKDHKKSRPWEKYEDYRLLAGIHRFGLYNWTVISEFVGNGRTRAQCSQRWFRGLDPRISKVVWSPEEDSKLLDLVAKNGSKAWTKTASELGHRSDAQCRYRFKQLKKLMIENNKKKKKAAIPVIQQNPVIQTLYIPTYQFVPAPIPEKQKLPSINCFMKDFNELSDPMNRIL